MQNTDYNSVSKTAYSHEVIDLVNPETGEFVPTITFQKTVYGGDLFSKAMDEFFEQLYHGTAGSYYKVLYYIIMKMNKSTNEFSGTYKKIEKETGLGAASVTRGIAWAKELNFIRMIFPGRWMMNPYYLARGDNLRIRKLQLKYDSLERRNEE